MGLLESGSLSQRPMTAGFAASASFLSRSSRIALVSACILVGPLTRAHESAFDQRPCTAMGVLTGRYGQQVKAGLVEEAADIGTN